MMTRHVYTQVGGVQENMKTVEQAGDVYAPVSKEIQKQAVKFLNKEVFQQPNWLLDPNVLNKFSKPAKREKVQRLQENAMYYIVNGPRFYRMYTEEMRYGREKVYTMDELLTDVSNGLWSELKSSQPIITSNRRALQKSWVENMIRVSKDAGIVPQPGSTSLDLTTTDIPAVLRSHMNAVMQMCKEAEARCTDPMTKAHLKYVQARLKKDLEDKQK
jgi:hypothetical protein